MVARGGGVSGFQVTGMIECGQKSKPPKKSLGLQTKPKEIPAPKFNPNKYPMPNFRAIKISVYFICGTKRPGVRGNYRDSSDCFEHPKISPYLNQATQKNTCQNFPTQKKPQNQKFQTLKNPSVNPVAVKIRS